MPLKTFALLLLSICLFTPGGSAFGQSQYPVFVNTGNPAADSANYNAALAQYDQQKQQAIGSSSRTIASPKTVASAGTQNAIFGVPGKKRSAISSSGSSNMRTIAESCLIPTDATWSYLPGNDDGSTSAISLGFNFDLYGTTYNTCYINNNGNITFGSSYYGYTPSGFPFSGNPMISGFWDDVDTRSCGTVRYKNFGTRLVVSYENVGQYSMNCGGVNTFQIVIGTNNDPLIGFGQNVKLFYGDMQWTKGASTVGINSGDGVNYVQVGRFGVPGSTAYDGGGGATDGLDYLDYQCFSFNVSSAGNQPPSMSGFPTGNTVSLGCGETANYTIQSLPPEVNQNVTTTVNTNGMCGVTTSITDGAVSTVNISVTGLACNAGTNVITFTSTDNGTPALTTTSTLTVIVGFATPTISASGPTTVCAPGSVQLTSSSGGSYQWMLNGSNIPGATAQTYNATSTGDYSVAVTNGTCTVNSVPTPVQINSAPAAVISASGSTTFCRGGAVTLTSSAGSSYLWSTGETSQSITVSTPGSYSVTVTGSGGCSATSAATSVAYTTGPDTDGDGIPDACDADDDNDGIPDATECNHSNFYWSNAPTASGNTATGVINGVNYTYTSSQTVLTTPTVFNHGIFPVSYTVPDIKCIQNIYASNNTLTFSSPISNPVLVFASIGQAGIAVPIEFSNPIDILWSTNVTKNSATRLTGNEGFAIVRLNGVFSSISFNYLANENYVNFLFGADFQTCGDTDNDGIPDYLDTDSDGDGCPDAIEGDQHPLASQIVNGRLIGGVDANGIPLIVNGGQGIGTSQSANANCNCQPGIDKTAPALVLNASGGALSSLGAVNTYTTAVPGSGTAGLSHAHGIAYDLERNTVWVTDQDLGNDVIEFPATQPGGSTINQLSRFHPALSGTIEGIAFDATDNTLWIVDFNGIVGHFSRTGSTLPGGFNVSGTMPSGTFGARSLGIGLEGSYIWVDNGQRAYRFNKSGGYYTNFNFVTGAPGITYDPERHVLWSSGWNDGRYRAYDPSNGSLVFTSNIISISQGHDLSIGAGRIWVGSENSFRDPVYSINIIGGALDQIIECHSTYTDPGYTATDNCGAVNVVVTGAVNANVTGTYVLTYTATDINGNVSTATRTVTVLDRTPPVPDVANLPAITGQCSATVTAPTATDACAGQIIGTTASPLSYTQPGTYTIVWTYTDANSNSVTQQQTVTVNDNTAPTISCPGNQVLASCETVIPNYTTSAVVSDNCTATGSIIITQSPVAGSPIASGATVTVTLTAKDASNNVSTPCSFTVTRPNVTPVANNDAATVCSGSSVNINVLANDTEPQGKTLTINDYVAPSIGTVVKNADNTFTYTAPAGYSGPVTFTYDVKASDATLGFSGNGHFYEWVPAYGITWLDAKAQAATKIYNGLHGYLVTVTSAAEMNFVATKLQGSGWMGASDRAYEGTWRWVTGPEGLEDGGQGRHFSNQNKNPYYYGNCSASTASGINGYYANWAGGEPNDCGANLNQYSPTDQNRGGEHYAHFYGGGIWNDYPNSVGGNIAGYVVEYGGLENCIPQLTATGTVTITVNALPTATIAAAGGTTACPGSSVTLNATATAGSGTLTGYQWSKNGSPIGGANSSSYAASSTGNYSVAVSNSNGCSSTSNSIAVTIIDVTAPVPDVAVLPAITAECSATVTAPTATDACTGAITGTTLDPVSFSAQGTFIIHWKYTDIYGNSSYQQQTVIIHDVTIPTFTRPADVTIYTNATCGYDASVAATGDVTDEHDNCSTGIQATYSDVTADGPCEGSHVITRTWHLVDYNGNAAEDQVQTITVRDNTAPTFTRPADVTIFTNASCGYDASVAATGDVTDEHDNCSTGIQATFSDVVNDGSCEGSHVITRTWHLVDNCGNAASDQVQTIMVKDNTAPTFTRPADVTIYTNATCGYDASTSATGDVTDEHDNCSTGIQATFSDVTVDGSCEGSHVITRTWHLVDNCGNAAADQVQTITVSDNTAPTFTRPADITIYTSATCGYDASVSATGDVTDKHDNCSTGIQATFSDVTVNGSCAGSHVITRTWHLVDNCGNAAADQVQTINVNDNTAPVITSVTASVFHCYDDKTNGSYSVPAITATDNCTASVNYHYDVKNSAGNVIRSGNSNNASGAFPAGTNTVAWTMTDDCGNSTTAQTTVVINPEITGVMSNFTVLPQGVEANTLYLGYAPASSANITITPAGGTAPYTYTWTTNGNAASFTVTANASTIKVTAVAGGTFTYTVVVKDSKGCTATFTKTITVVDIRCGQKNDKVVVCHVPKGNPGNPQTICIDDNAVPTHLGDGDYLGICNGAVMVKAGAPKGTVTDQEPELTAFPNPNRGQFNLRLNDFKSGKIRIEITDGHGKVVLLKDATVSYKSEDIFINVMKLAAGMYNVKVTGETEVKYTRIIIAH